MDRPVLFDYFTKTANVLKAQYERSSDQNASNNLGKNRETFCSSFLTNVLPPKLSIKSGEIWDSKGHKTGQLDLIIIRDDAPSLEFGSDNTYLAEGVFSIIEVKSNLTRGKLIEAGNTFQKVEKLVLPPQNLKIGKQINRPLRIVFAYEGASWETLFDEIRNQDWFDLFDVISILDKGVLLTKGRLLDWEDDSKYSMINSSASSIGFIYFYLISYGTSFIYRTIGIDEYFKPIQNWNE